MRRTAALQGVRMIKFLDILGRYEALEFNQLEAAELLGVCERTFRRWRQRFEDDGEAGLLDRRLGKAFPLRRILQMQNCEIVVDDVGAAVVGGRADEIGPPAEASDIAMVSF